MTRRILAIVTLLFLTACAEAELVSHAAKTIQPEPVEPQVGHYKVGNPYEVNGVWYYPELDYSYRESGIASWYGPKFHGKRTANGEIYDQYQLTAAHQTLPLPSMARVTNLENGRSIVVRINDRGPFKNGRIIDVSTRSAELLGFKRAGTAKVLVEILTAESRQLAVVSQSRDAAAYAPDAVPIVPVETVPLASGSNGTTTPTATTVAAPAVNGSAAQTAPQALITTSNIAALPTNGVATNYGTAAPAAPAAMAGARAPLAEPQPDGVVSRKPVRPTSIYVQAGAFQRRDNAIRLGARLSVFGETSITEAWRGQLRFYRVRLGPVTTVEAADQLLTALLQNGHREARVVVD